MTTSHDREESPAFDPLLLNGMRTTAQIAAALVIIVAILVLCGWAFNIEPLRSMIPGLTAMNPGGTAFAFLLAGGSLLCLAMQEKIVLLTRAAWAMAAVVVVLASLRMVLYSLGLEWGPDQWLFRAKLDFYQPPNRMAPNTALGLLLIGAALLLLDFETRRGHRPAQWLAVAAALLSLFTLVGYLLNSPALIGIPAYIPMGLNSAGTLGLLAIGTLFSRPDRGIMAVVSHSETGGVMARRLLLASILAPAAFAWLSSMWQQAGMVDPSLGDSLFVLATIVLFTTLIWYNASSLNRVDADRSRSETELKRKSAILQSVLNSMGDGVVVADRDGRFLIFNPVAERLLGLAATDAPPEEWSSQYGLFSPETGEPLKRDEIPLVRAIHGESTNQVELLIKSPRLPDGIHISVTGRPLKGDDGIEGGVVVFQDTTQRRRAAQALSRARDEANAANRAKSEFLANMSHEIRTPMNAVIGMTELVLDSELSEVQRNYLRIVKDSAESLLSLINDILDFSKIEAGKLELDHVSFQLRDVLGDTMKTLSMRVRGKELELACHVAPQVPEYLVGDPHRLRQVVTNLVGNALKFTEHGEVVLDVTPEEQSNDYVRIHVRVRDTGIGIPREKLHLLLSAFSQVDASTTRKYGGTGLGLAITARLVPLMKGQTWVESEPGKGSTFHFTAAFEKDASPPPPPAAPEALKNLRVLIVDDNATNRLILNELLTAWDMRPTAVASAKAALDELRCAADANDPFRVVLSDVQMPDVDGFELASQIRQDDHFGGTVIMMLSSGAGPGEVTRCRDLGASSHLMKPIKSSELFTAIATVIGADSLHEEPVIAGIESIRPLNILLAEDSVVNQQLARGVLGKWGHSLTIVNNGLEAVEAAEHGHYDVILMDVQMPVMDGFQATARIRESEQRRGTHVPIVAMTAHAMKGDREECLHAGMDDYVTKPIRWPELRQALDRAVSTATSVEIADDSAMKNPHVEATKSNPPVPSVLTQEETLDQSSKSHAPSEWMLDWDEALSFVNGDRGLLRDILEELVKEWPLLLADLDRAVTSDDAIVLKRAAHTIRGSLRFFGVTEASELADKIEVFARTSDAAGIANLLPLFHDRFAMVVAEVQRRLNSMEAS